MTSSFLWPHWDSSGNQLTRFCWEPLFLKKSSAGPKEVQISYTHCLSSKCSLQIINPSSRSCQIYSFCHIFILNAISKDIFYDYKILMLVSFNKSVMSFEVEMSAFKSIHHFIIIRCFACFRCSDILLSWQDFSMCFPFGTVCSG